MASLRLHLANFLIRTITKRRLSKAQTPVDVRKVFNGIASVSPGNAAFTQAVLGGIAGEWALSRKDGQTRADGPGETPAMLYLHGGGYVAMAPKTHRAITGAFAMRGFRVFAADYRLAPENPFPAAVDDALACWRALRKETPGPVVVAGDSAGGGLTMALILALKAAGEALPTAACLFSPWTDLALTGPSMRSNKDREALLPVAGINKVAGAYLGGTDPMNPLASPLYGDFTGLPPMIIYAGDTEILLDDSTRLAARAQAAGVIVDLNVWPAVPHVWQALNAFVPEARRSMDEAAAFLLAVCSSGAGAGHSG